ncbi:hypothetical protein [Bradyrhizobium sp. dw_78]|uniref:hypothetical protein n=1 Tax=Bradyrhizobium sp. dw_78 TaxID=2719793 RepID=UPI001BD5E7AA|nr:hypothetical protein [Bradyrhizobium sp. dw_78]
MDFDLAKRSGQSIRDALTDGSGMIFLIAEETMMPPRDTMAELLMTGQPHRRFAAMTSGLDIHYDLGEGG